MDAQIWYAIFSTLFGGIYGAFRRLGEVCIAVLRLIFSLIFSYIKENRLRAGKETAGTMVRNHDSPL